MRTIAITAILALSAAAPAQAQFENFLGSTGFSNFNGTGATAGCISGASGNGGPGFGTTTCNSSASGDYSFNSFESVTGGTFNQLTVGELNTGSQSSQGIQSQWVMNDGPKTGGNTITNLNSNFSSFSGTQATEISGGEFNSGTSTSFTGWGGVNTTSNYTIPMMNMGGMGGGGGD